MSAQEPNPLQLLHDHAGCCKPVAGVELDPEPCPECAQGKHGNCDGTTWDNLLDEPAPCPCDEAGHE